MNLDLKYYASVFLRRIYVLVIIAFGVTATATYVALELPPKYRAQARLLVESAQIPTDLAASTVTTGTAEQLQIIQQRLMTRENLLQIARSHGVFARKPQMSADDIVSSMRAQTDMRQSGGGRGGGATFMTIGFSSSDSDTAAQVVNEYVTRILEENRGIRTALAEQTLDFFQQEVNRLGVELDQQSDRIIEFKRRNSNALPSSGSYLQSRQTSLQERSTQIVRELGELEDQRERLVTVYESGGSVTSQQQLSPEEQRLQNLRKELDSALVVYSPQNPRIRMLEAQIAQMEERVAASAPAASVNDAETETQDPRKMMLDMQLAEVDAREEYLQNQQAFIESELAGIAESLEQLPQVTIAIDGLERDYANIQSQYNQAVSRLSLAATGERIELLSKGQRIAVIEQATVPNTPTSPNRPLIAGGGALAGVALGAAAIVLLELLNQSIRRPVDLERKLGITPIATLPYIRTRRELIWKRLVILLLIALVVVGGPAALYAVHTYYMPLDLLIERIMNKVLPWA
ncbi:GumC family protein [Roseitranquillus sediminis]|uniref:GumC family protein n=1 Tax=Roseitranquillus sediminis TaxID=2809051 RepID=UPI001D0C6311|nr:lipopolysaccharide biosynthesis protein [Roseitranquillus sediminis]MBM9596187.1 lipopolysaccharide biosynthesis protein [Roseitranquillus sediminis]